MIFYISDDLQTEQAQSKKNPNKQYINKWCDAWAVDRKNGDCDYCPLCGRPVSMLKWLEPYKMRVRGNKYPDRITTWLNEPLVVSESFKNAYESEGLRGITRFVPIEIVQAPSVNRINVPPRYFLAETCFNRSIQLNVDKTKILGIKQNHICSLCNPFGQSRDQVLHLELDSTRWNGDDVCKIYAVGVVFSERFFDFVQRYAFTNFNLIPVDSYRK